MSSWPKLRHHQQQQLLMLDVITILRVTAATAFSISFFHLHPEAHDARYSTHQLDMPDTGTGSHSVRLYA